MSPAIRQPRALIGLVAGVGLFAAEALRMSGPLLDRVAEQDGVPAVVVTALIGFALPGLAGVLVGGVGARRAAVLAVAALVVLRLAMQAVPGLLVGLATVAAAVAALVLALRQAAYQRDGAVPAVTGLVLGGAVDVALRTLLVTWDPVWRSGVLAWLVVLAECAVLLALLAAARPWLWRDPHPVLRPGVLGGYLGLWVLVIGSPAFTASASGLNLPFAGAVLLVGALFAVEALSRSALPGGSGRWPDLTGRYAGGVAAGLLVAGVTAAILLTGVMVAVAVLAAQVGAALVLARALCPVTPIERWPTAWTDPGEREAAEKLDRGVTSEEDDAYRDLTVSRRPWPRSTAGFGLAGLAAGWGYLFVVLLYQLHDEISLPVPPQVVPILAAVALGALALGERAWTPPGAPPASRPAERDERAARRGRLAPLAALPAILLLAPVAVLATTPAPAAPSEQQTASLRIVSWNIRYARDPDGFVDPGTIVATIAAQRPDVVLLQEVGRGRPAGGTLDAAEWLSRRLAMPYVYAPAADGRLGNLILSRLRITDGRTGVLPPGDGGTRRSYAGVTVELPGGRTVQLFGVRLADRDAATRLTQLETVLGSRAERTPAVIAGTLNAAPGSPVLRRIAEAGLVSAQHTTGHGGMPSHPSLRPVRRIDWIVGTAGLAFTDFAMPRTTVSDHLPLAVTVQVG